MTLSSTEDSACGLESCWATPPETETVGKRRDTLLILVIRMLRAFWSHTTLRCT